MSKRKEKLKKVLKNDKLKSEVLKAVLVLEALVNIKCLLTVSINNLLALLNDFGIKTEDITNVKTCQSTKNRRKP